MHQRVLYSWRWRGTDMAIAHYCPKPVWPLSRPGFTVITPKVQKPTHCLDTFQHLNQVQPFKLLLSPQKCKNIHSVQTHFSTWLNMCQNSMHAKLLCNEDHIWQTYESLHDFTVVTFTTKVQKHMITNRYRVQ